MKPVDKKHMHSRFPKNQAGFKRKTLSASILALLLIGFQAPAFAVDSDGDGIDDSIEGTDDIDNDGLPNYLDTDSNGNGISDTCLLYTSPSPRDKRQSRMPSSA